MTDIRPFRIDIPEKSITDLQARLALTRFPEKETPDDWTQGVPLAYMRQIRDYWAERYDWRRAEARINAFPQFMTTIDGVDIHFIHVRSPAQHRAPAGAHPRLAGLNRRVPQGHRPARGPGSAWRRPGRCIPRGMPLAAGLWFLRQTDRAWLGRREDSRYMGDTHGPSRLRQLLRPGRRLGLRGNNRASVCATPRTARPST